MTAFVSCLSTTLSVKRQYYYKANIRLCRRVEWVDIIKVIWFSFKNPSCNNENISVFCSSGIHSIQITDIKNKDFWKAATKKKAQKGDVLLGWTNVLHDYVVSIFLQACFNCEYSI